MSIIHYSIEDIKTFWHMSKALYVFDSTYPFNTINAFFFKGLKAEFENWLKTENTTIEHISGQYSLKLKVSDKGKSFIAKIYSQKLFSPATILIQKWSKKRTFVYVVLEGPVLDSRPVLQEFLGLLHRNIDINYSQFLAIYSEQYVRYKEEKEEEVSKAIEHLYKLFGYAETKHNKKKNGNSVVDIHRARLYYNEAEFHIKTYRPKKYNSPAKSLFDNPKLEAVVYFTRSKNGQERINELEQTARNLLATIVDFTELYDYLLPSGNGFNHSGKGKPIKEVEESLKANSVITYYSMLSKLPEAILRNSTARKVLKELATGPKTTLEMANCLGVTQRTIQRTIKLLMQYGYVEKIKNKRHIYYKLMNNGLLA